MIQYYKKLMVVENDDKTQRENNHENIIKNVERSVTKGIHKKIE